MELWLLLSIISVALILIPLIKGRKDGKFTRRKAAVILVAAPILFVLSGLFLANTVVNPAESLPYQVGRALCFAASPTLMLSGVIVYIAAPHEEKKPATAQQLPLAQPGEKPVTSMPKWEKKARKIYGVTALLLIGLLVLTWSPLMLFGLVRLIPYILLSVYLLMDKRGLVASLFFLLLWYVWFSPLSGSMSPLHFSQLFTEAMRNQPYFGPLGYDVWWMFYSVLMFSGVVMLLFSSLSGVKRMEKVMTRIFTVKTCALVLTVPVILMFALPPGLVTNPLARHPSVVTAQATEIGINKDRTERYFNDTGGEWVYSIAVRYNGNLMITNISLGGKIISPPFDNSVVRITENNGDVTPNFSNSGVIVIRDKAFVNWVSLVRRNALGEAIYGVGWF